MIATYNQTTNILLFESILYLLLIVIVVAKANFQERSGGAFILYASVSCLLLLEEVFWQMGWLDFLDAAAYIWGRIPFYGVLISSILLLHLTQSFLRFPGAGWRWWAAGIGLLAALIIMNSNLLPLSELLWVGTTWGMSRTMLALGLLLLGWSIFIIGSVYCTHMAYRRSQQPLHKNRIRYWLPVLGFIIGGNILLLAGKIALGSNIHLLGTLIAAYAVITHRLPDIRHAIRRMMSYLLITLITFGIYLAGIVTLQSLFQTVPGYNPILAGAAMALILVIVSQSLLRLVQRVVNWLIFGTGYESSQILSAYGLSVSNILDLERLATVAIDLIHKTLGSQRGSLFIVHHTLEPNNDEVFILQGVKGAKEKVPPPIKLAGNSPVTHFLQQEHRPLTQYDIDLRSRFHDTSEAERAWFSDLGMDVYVPIHAKDVWIGLLALGPKVSGDRYFKADRTLLTTLADQTAVALENARLVEDLKNLNIDIERAYSDLDWANRRMQELDKLKSAFIGVITHELRTPFANTMFSLEVLERHGRKYLPAELQTQLEQVEAGAKTSKQMIDNLVTFATFLSKQGELRPTRLDFSQVIREGLFPLKSLAEVVGLTVHVEIAEELPTVYGDQEHLADTIYHLIHNAIKFTGAGGEVWVKCQSSDNNISFEVEDTGVGVPADMLPTLWEGFTQMADPLLRGVEGLGLGLALVKYVVTAHNGEVWAHSEEGVGSTFGFSIPLENAEISVG